LRAKLLSAFVLCLAVSLVSGCDRIRLMLQVATYEPNLADATAEDTTTTDVVANRDANGRTATLLSAFFGLDDALPAVADQVICEGATGQDGMPVIFSHEIDVSTMQAGDFRVVSASGAVGDITCVTLAPADDEGEHRTVLTVGQFGSVEDRPASVEIVGNLLSKDGRLNFRGSQIDVTLLEEGPTMQWAELVPVEEWALGKPATSLPFGGGSGCPEGTRQVVRVTWAGGVTKPGGQEVDEKERSAYSVAMSTSDGQIIELAPFAIGDLGDGDNNHELCLDRLGMPSAVEFPAGLVTDPREDLNPASRVDIFAGPTPDRLRSNDRIQ